MSGRTETLREANALILELEAELAKVKEQWEFAAKAMVKRAEAAEYELESLRAALQVLVDKETVDTGVRDWARSVLEARRST